MASLPAFHCFNQTASDEQYGSPHAPIAQSMLQVKTQDPPQPGDFEVGNLGGAAVQAGQVFQIEAKATNYDVKQTMQDDFLGVSSLQNIRGTITAVDGAQDGARGGDSLGSPPVQATQKPEFPVNKPGDDSVGQDHGASFENAQDIASALASLRVVASSMPFNPNDPATVAILQQIFNLERLQAAKLQSDAHSDPNYQRLSSELARLRAIASTKPLVPEDPAIIELGQQIFNIERKLARLDSDSHPSPVLPIVSLDIPASIIFMTIRIARFLLRSAIPPAALAAICNMVFYRKSDGISVLIVALFSALAVVATTLFYLVSSIQTMIKKNKAKFNNKAQSDLSHLAAASYLFVLGSGGHTTEMISLVKLSQKPYIHTHRRYLMAVGDKHSLSQAKKLEEDIAHQFPNGSAGTSDLVTVTRARSVHQSYITSVFTSLKCFFEIVDALTNVPPVRLGLPNAKAFRSPHVIVTNGPGTGFIVGLVAFVLKVFRIVPHDRLRVVFVETWARTHSLGLTGKLFNLTQLADVFVVQSEGLAKTYNKPNIGNVNKKWAALVNSTSKEVQGAE